MRGKMDVLTNPRSSLESHLMAFVAEESRLTQTVIDMNAFRQEAEESAKGYEKS